MSVTGLKGVRVGRIRQLGRPGVRDCGNRHVAGDAEFAGAPNTNDVSSDEWVWAQVDAAYGPHSAGGGLGVGFVCPGEATWEASEG